MVDENSAPVPRCQWCSAVLPAPALETCPSCGATLTSTTNGEEIRGVTTLDPEAILRARTDAVRPRGRLMSFITGEQPVDPPGPGEAESLAPPDEAVRREMLRLQMEAERADLEAESLSLKTDVVVEHGLSLTELAAADADHDGSITHEEIETAADAADAEATPPPAPPEP